MRKRFNHILALNQDSWIAWLNQHCSRFSLLHGDLWSGNVLFDAQNVWLIDPAVYFGDSETDIAMTEMFGGFPEAFYAAYQSVKPLSSAYPKKRILYNLYHYLNHYNLFGSAYLPACERGFQKLDQGLE
ncbi:MAG: fructosamine kinase family protein [Marinicella sp.]